MPKLLKIKKNVSRMHYFFSFFLLFFLCLGNSCSKKSTSQQEQTQNQGKTSAKKKILLLGNGAEPQGLDTQLTTGVTESQIINALCEGLLNYHLSNDYKVEYGVAEKFTFSEDKRIWTFFLRKNATWSNGDLITAKDFVYSYQRMLSPALGAKYADMLYVIENAAAFHKGEITDFSQVGVRAIDTHTLEFTLTGPTPYFPSLLKHHAWFPVHKPTIEKFGKMDDPNTQWTRPGNYVGNGPYILTEWKLNQIIKVEKNPHYWDAETVKIDAIHFFPGEDANTEVRAFRAGKRHKTPTVPLNLVPVYQEKHPEWIHIDPYYGTYFYRFNVTKKPFDNLKVRQALALAIDRAALIDNIVRGGKRPAFGYTPHGGEGYQTPHMLSFNPEKARQLLAEAGYPNGKGFPKTNLLINTSEDHRKVAQYIQQQWKKHLNIEISISNEEWKVYLDTVVNLQFEIARAGWIADYMDPHTFLSMWTKDNGNNNTGWHNEKFEQLLEKSGQTADQTERFHIMQEAEKILLTELPIIPLYWYTSVYLLDPKVKNWHPKLLDNRPYKYVDIEEE